MNDWREMWHWWNAYDEPFSLEEETYRERYLETEYTCSEAAGTLLRLAELPASQEFHTYFYFEEPDEPRHYDAVTEKMRLAAAELTGRDREQLEQVARAAFVAAASIDPDADGHWWPEYWSHRPNPHHYYRILSGLLWAILKEKAMKPRAGRS